MAGDVNGRRARDAKVILEHEARLSVLEKYGIYKTLDDLKNAVAGINLPYTLLTENGRAEYTYTLGNFINKIDDIGIVALNGVSVDKGALVLQQGSTIAFSALSIAQPGTVSDKLRRFVVVTDHPWNAKGDGISDDYPAIQAALDYVGSCGGGEVLIPLSLKGRYRLTKGLKMTSYTTLRGVSATRYPYNAGNASGLLADFDDPMQWVIEPRTTHNNQNFNHNQLITDKIGPEGGLPNGPTFNCTVRDLVISSKGTLPYGGIRMHGCPGSIIDNVGIHNVGIGALINCCFGGKYSVHCLTAYYGVIAWDDVNGNNFEIYCARQTDYTSVVPDAYQTPTNKNLFNIYTSNHGFSKNDHFNRSTGFILGSLTTTSNTNVVEYVGERFTNGLFSLFAYSTIFKKFYVESDLNVMLSAIVSARSNLKFDTFHAYLSGGGEFFDIGFGQTTDLTVNGIAFSGSWGSIQANNTVKTIIRGRSFDEFGPISPQYNLIYENNGNWKIPNYSNNWQSTDSPDIPVGYRKEGDRVFLRGSIGGGNPNVPAFIFPVGYRPSSRMVFKEFLITANGELIPLISSTITLNATSFEV